VDWDLSHLRTVKQVGWPADRSLADPLDIYLHISKPGNVRLRLAPAVVVECRSRLVTVCRRGKDIEYVGISMRSGTSEEVSEDAYLIARSMQVHASSLVPWLSDVRSGKLHPLIVHAGEARSDLQLEILDTLNPTEPFGLEVKIFLSEQ
jgi:hypothetical protein